MEGYFNYSRKEMIIMYLARVYVLKDGIWIPLPKLIPTAGHEEFQEMMKQTEIEHYLYELQPAEGNE